MFLVLCESGDEAALWAYGRLLERGIGPIHCITAQALAYARWVHRVGGRKASVELALPDGRFFRSAQVRGTLNRLLVIPRDSLVLIHPADREYVGHELSAFFASWLHCLPGPMLNRGTAQGLSGRIRHISEWIWLAGRCGLPVPEYLFSSLAAPEEYALHAKVAGAGPPQRTVIVVDGNVFGHSMPDPINEGCRRFAARSQLRIVGVDFAMGTDGEWRLVGASSCPDLRIGGDSLVDCLAGALGGRSVAA